MRGTPSPLGLPLLSDFWDPLVVSGSWGRIIFAHLISLLGPHQCLHTCPAKAPLLRMWSARVHAWVRVGTRVSM